jgi:hypothetical protein
MANRTNKNDPWRGPNSSFPANEGPPQDSDKFAPVDTRGLGLRGFLEQELQQRNPTFESCSSETLGPGVYIRTQNNRTELVVYRGRQSYDIYSGEREALIAFANEHFIKES